MKLATHLLLCAFLLTATSAFAQFPLSFGVKAGVPLTDAFSRTLLSTFPLPPIYGSGQPLYGYSDSRNYIVGATVELRLPLHVSVEADALYRPLDVTKDVVVHSSGSIVIVDGKSTSYSSWEFPVLAKVHFGLPIVKPYLDAGPSFRTMAAPISYLSSAGFTLGAGGDVKALFLRVSPEFRYTRWGTDGTAAATQTAIPSRRDQVEFLVGFSF